MSTSVKRRPKVATADSAKQRAVLDAVSRTLTEVTVRYYESLTHEHLLRLKKAIKLLRDNS